jgi:outer membrane lipoprotein-sorting protein
MNYYLFRFAKLIVYVSPLLLLIACASTVPISKEVSFDSIMKDVQKKSYLVRQFRADFTKTRHAAVFARDVVVHGTLIFQKPNNLRLKLSGDVNVEILSDGENISITHDGIDQEIFHVDGQRDMSRFSDPLMLLLQNIEDNGLRRFAVVKTTTGDGSMSLQLKPVNDNNFERMRTVTLTIGDSGEIRKVGIFYKDGDYDETVFNSWAMLTSNDPEIERLDNNLQRLAELSEKGYSGLYSKSSLEPGPLRNASMKRLEAKNAVDPDYFRSGR